LVIGLVSCIQTRCYIVPDDLSDLSKVVSNYPKALIGTFLKQYIDLGWYLTFYSSIQIYTSHISFMFQIEMAWLDRMLVLEPLFDRLNIRHCALFFGFHI
jgi:hypothetical protein